MICSMVAFSIADTLIKVSTTFLSPAQVMFYLMFGGMIIFSVSTLLQGNRLIDRRAIAPILLLRYIAEVTGMLGMVMALANVPISTVGAVTQAAPIVAALGAVLFLREKIGWRRWSSIVFGFLGVLLIVQPGAVKFDVAVLWALLALVALSVRDLTTRLAPKDMATTSLATYTVTAALPFISGWMLLNGESFFPAHTNWVIVLPMVIIGSTGYLLLTLSLRMAEVSVVMPFRYSRVVFLLGIGAIVFDERPNALMLVGAVLIIASGCYMMWRERIVKH